MNRTESEQSFLNNYDAAEFDSPLCSVDMTIFTVLQDRLHILLVKRSIHPAKGEWALPGGVVDTAKDDCLEATAVRKLKDRTGIVAPYLEQVTTVGNRNRDPRHWSLSVLYFALMPIDGIELAAGHGSDEARWFPVTEDGVETLLAFDHAGLLKTALERIRNKAKYTMLPAYLLAEAFTLTELVGAYQQILGDVEQAMIRKRALRSGVLEETGELSRESNRPAKLYRIRPGGMEHFFERVISG
jgi:ADP-ribose pyrophosphatase YjhB (NUDIX family)